MSRTLLRISDLVLLPVLGTLVLYAGVRIVVYAHRPMTGPLAGMPRDLRLKVEALEAPDVETRREAAMFLSLASRIEKARLRPAVPFLVEALGDDDEQVRFFVGEALKELGRPAVLALMEAAGDEERAVSLRVTAIQVLGEMGRKAREAAQLLAELATSDDEEIRVAARRALREVASVRRMPRRRRW